MTPPQLSIEDLLTERTWLSRMCDRLVRDAADADDLAQEAITRALGTPSAAEAQAGGRLRGWLAITARNVVKENARTSVHRKHRERDVARPEVSQARSVADVMASAELREQLARLVMTLPEPEREAVVLRYYEGLGARESATRLGDVSEGAVRQRLYRGMERLRSSLDAESSERGRAWVPAAIGFSRFGSSASKASGFGGGLLIAAAVCAAAILAFAWVALAPGNGASQPSDLEAKLASPQPMEGPEVVSLPTPAASRVPATPVIGAHSPRQFRLLHPTSGAPIAGSEWSLMVTGELDPEPFGGIDPQYLPPFPPLASGVTDASGKIELPPFDHDLAQLIVARSGHHATASFAIDGRVPPGSVTALRAPLGRTVRGRVVNKAGQPVGGVEIVELDSMERVRPVTRTDPTGRFEITGIAPLPRQIFRRQDGEAVSIWTDSSRYFMRPYEDAPWSSLSVRRESRGGLTRFPEDSVQELGDVTIQVPRLVRGIVYDEAGQPAVGAKVGLESSFQPIERLLNSNPPNSVASELWLAEKHYRRFGVTDKHGRFEVSVFGSHRGRRSSNRLAAVAVDGATGRPLARASSNTDESDEVVIEVSIKNAVRFRLRDEKSPDGRLLLPLGTQRRAAWFRLQDRAAVDPNRRVSMQMAELTDADLLVLPRAGFRQKHHKPSPNGIWLEVPGYEPTRVAVDDPDVLVEVALERRTRRRVEVRFASETALPNQVATLFLVSTPMEDASRLATYAQIRMAPPATGTSGGFHRAASSGDTVELAWPWSQPAWLVVLPHPAGPYRLTKATVVGPLMAPADGSVIDVALEPWDPSDQWGERDLDAGTVVPLY